MPLWRARVRSLEELRRCSEVPGLELTLSADVIWPFRDWESWKSVRQRGCEGLRPLQQEEKMLRAEMEEARRLGGLFC